MIPKVLQPDINEGTNVSGEYPVFVLFHYYAIRMFFHFPLFNKLGNYIKIFDCIKLVNLHFISEYFQSSLLKIQGYQ